MEQLSKNYYGYIYYTYDQKTKKIYVGQSTNTVENSTDYFGSGVWVRNIIKKRGTYFFKKQIIGYCYSKEELNYAELICIEFYNSNNPIYGLNIREGGTNGKLSIETRNKIGLKSKARIRTPLSDQQRINLSIAKKGHIVTIATREKIRKSLKGRVISKEIGEKISIILKNKYKNDNLVVWNKGLTKKTSEIINKMSIASIGKHNSLKGILKTEQHKQNMRKPKSSTCNMKHLHSAEHCKNISAAKKDTCYINNKLISKVIKKHLIASYLKNGWFIGRLSYIAKNKPTNPQIP